jgi:uncharacterized protein
MTALLRSLALACCLLVSLAHADELSERLEAIPNPRVHGGGWVADPAGVISRRQQDINAAIGELERETGVEIAVVVLPTIGALAPKPFATELFQKWSIGKAGRDNGLLVLHVLDQRRLEIETGYGMEGLLPDLKTYWIANDIAVPFFKEGSFADGHLEVVRALARAIRQPDIGHDELISSLGSTPGANQDALPQIPKYDEIALRHTSFIERAWRSLWTPLALLMLAALSWYLLQAVYTLRTRRMPPSQRRQVYLGKFRYLQYASVLPAGVAAFVLECARTGTFFSPWPVLGVSAFSVAVIRNYRLVKLRKEPRVCACGQAMRQLSEKADNAHLEPGQSAEELIKSVDYDVWLCGCGKTQIEAYAGDKPGERCEKCGYRTDRPIKRRTLQSATTSSQGLREVTYACAHCQHQRTVEETIAAISTSSSSDSGSSGSSSSSSSSSFGGGSSGGGGSGASY